MEVEVTSTSTTLVIPHAHVVSHWGASFRKKYGILGTIRAFLPRGTPMIALSATLPARVRNGVLSKLQFSQDYVNIDIGNDRPNVSIIICGIHHPLNTYADLDFIVAGVKSRVVWKGGMTRSSTSPFPLSLRLAYNTSAVGPSICFVRTHAITSPFYTQTTVVVATSAQSAPP